MTLAVLAIFALAYAGLALGRVPGLALDRAGMAVVAAILLVAIGAVPPGEVLGAIHFPTLVLLFALMVVSSRFAAAGAYDLLAARIAAAAGSPTRLLVLTTCACGLLSAVLVNDVVAFVMAPLLVRGLRARGLDPRPFLAALAGAANAGSAATIIGNPQNIVIGQVGGLHFGGFVLACAPPALAALAATIVAVRLAWARELAAAPTAPPPPMPPLDRPLAARAAIAALLMLVLFLSPVPRELAAIAVAGLLLPSRRHSSRDMLAGLDWPLLLLFAALFVLNHALAGTGLARAAVEWLGGVGVGLDTLAGMLPFALVASNTIGNVPAVVMLLAAQPGWGEGVLQALALTTTLAGNLLLVGSVANLIV
ncbi:MAG: anion transporter, partial [Alphaproteobacteria bacterium]|nr:anion transporter [Alphaproteobacteria bacterium]